MMVSLPPEMMRPSGYSEVGGRYVMALMKAEPCDVIKQSYLGGLLETNFHRRTVASLEADRTNDECGKTTPRT